MAGMFSRNRQRLGIIANEFFDPRISRIGGFGILTRQIVNCAAEYDDPKIDVDLYWGEPPEDLNPNGLKVYDRPLHIRTDSYRRDRLRLLLRRPDLFLTIDYRDAYNHFLHMFPRVPHIMWVQDPKAPDDWERIATAIVPGKGRVEPAGLGYIDCFGLGKVVEHRAAHGAPTIFAVPTPYLETKILGTYGVTPKHVRVLPYPMDPVAPPSEKASQPTVLFLGRLDPQKRPWVCAAVAEKMPHVKFQMMGTLHAQGEGRWEAENLPPNLELLGHLDGKEKFERISQAWLLINTSIHEGLPVSFVEALQCETPLVSCVNPERVPERFGEYVGEFRGDGMSGVDTFVETLDQLIKDEGRRAQLGAAGRQWANETHSRPVFAQALKDILANPTAAADAA